MSDDADDFIALEKGNYARFDVLYNTRRPTQAPSKFDAWDGMQLPNNSVLHTLNGWGTVDADHDGMPDPTIPLVLNERFPVWLKIHTQFASESSKPFGVKESYVYRTGLTAPLIPHFYHTNRRFHRILSDRMIGTMPSSLTWIDYSPLSTAKVNGTLHAYRKFDIMFRTILDRVVAIGDNVHHYILLPQSDHVFTRMQMQRAFKELTTGSLGTLSQDPTIFSFLHVLAYVFGRTRELDVTPYKEDVKILGKGDASFDEAHTTSLLERLQPSILSSINFIFQKDNQAIVYNLGDLTRFAEDGNFFIKFYRHIMALRLNGKDVGDELENNPEQFDQMVEQVAEGKDQVPPAVTTPATDTIALKKEDSAGIPLDALSDAAKRSEAKVVQATTPQDDNAFEREVQPNSFEARLRNKVVEQSQIVVQAEPKKEAKRNTLLEQHLNVTIGGKPIGELIQPPSTQRITPKAMTYITSTPEVSYQKSSLLSIDQAYQEHGYQHEMAKVVGSLAKHGMFITKVEETKVHTEMDRTTTYRLHLTDLNGKSHHVKYTLPDIDKNGLMKLSGIEYKLTRQIANLPICKTAPTRVNLSSYYNKIIVERVQSKRYSYEQSITKFLTQLKNDGLIEATMGVAPLPVTETAYDYSAIGRHFTDIVAAGYHFYFTPNHVSFDALSPQRREELRIAQEQHGPCVGTGPDNSFLIWKLNGQITVWQDNLFTQTWSSFTHFLSDTLGPDGTIDKTAIEWTQAKILNQVVPLIYILGYRLGLKRVLDMIRLDYRFYTDKKEIEEGIDDVVVKFADGTLVFNRYPISRSLIACGLLWTDLRKFNFNSLSVPDTYAQVFSQKGLSVGVLKGLNGFFDFFVDPITESILEKMGEPITFAELLLRANVMLTDYVAKPSSSIELHRFRAYERFNGMLYNEIARGLQSHRSNPSTKKSFSINPEAVFQKIVQDATVSANEVINPVHEVKQRANFTFTGAGGRNGTSFVLNDRIYPQDGLGIISESVPDSGKVGITAYLSASPNIDDIHGIPTTYKQGMNLEAPQILSIANMVMPGGTTDDGKRANYLSIQMSHYVPNHEDGETLAVRTGYDEVLPHLSSGVFSVSAKDKGVVELVDMKAKVVRVRYADVATDSIRKLKLMYLDTVIDSFLREGKSFGCLVPDTEISHYPIGGVFELTRSTFGKIADRLRCDNVDSIPDKDVIRKYPTLVQDLAKKRYQALYYIRFTPVSSRTPGPVESYSFADIYSQNSGSYLLQQLVPNVKEGERFNAGDILLYNKGFFVPDPMSKQVTFKHGVTAMVALVEKSSNHEDACEISREMSNRLKMTPCHQCTVVTKYDAAILGIVQVGQHVETSSSLCVISDEYLIGSSRDVSSENLDIFEKLNRQTPQAGYTGTIVKVRMLYSCDRDELSESLKGVLKVYEKEVRDNFKALNSDPRAKPPERPGWVQPGTKYAGTDFSPGTVILEFMISETLSMSEGDKLCIAGANKSIVSHVNEKPHYSESGIPVDILFSTTSIINRIVASPLTVGIVERNMEALKKQAVDMYFK